MQDAVSGTELVAAYPLEIKVQPKDKISIIVKCENVDITNLFNLLYTSQHLGSTSEGNSSAFSNNQIAGYTVDDNGNIDFPMIGSLHVAGLNRSQIAALVKEKISPLAKNPIVTVEYLNLCISVMGEVKSPGRFKIDRDEITLLDAISMAGDLTITGKRESVIVYRNENGTRKVYRVNLCSAADIMASPVAYLQQNDIVYVEPNSMRARQSTVNGNNVLSTSFWVSLASLLISVAVLIKR